MSVQINVGMEKKRKIRVWQIAGFSLYKYVAFIRGPYNVFYGANMATLRVSFNLRPSNIRL